MKKMLLLSAVVCAAAMFSTACTSITTSDGATPVPQPASTHPGYAAKFEIEKTRVSGDAQINVLFGLFTWGGEGFAENSDLSTFSFMPSPANFAKSAAVYNACQANSSDTLVGTRYKVVTTDYFVFATVKCTVSGYPATMVGVQEKKPYVLSGGGNNPDTIVYLDEKPDVLK